MHVLPGLLSGEADKASLLIFRQRQFGHHQRPGTQALLAKRRPDDDRRRGQPANKRGRPEPGRAHRLQRVPRNDDGQEDAELSTRATAPPRPSLQFNDQLKDDLTASINSSN